MREAGLNMLHLLPAYDFGSVPEKPEEQQEVQVGRSSGACVGHVGRSIGACVGHVGRSSGACVSHVGHVQRGLAPRCLSLSQCLLACEEVQGCRARAGG